MTFAPIRSALFVPCSRPDRIPKALAAGADVVIADLEDAVEQDAKDAARLALSEFLGAHPDARLVVRVNAVDTPQFAQDLRVCLQAPGVVAVMLPKADSASHIRAAACGKPIWPIIESARAVLALGEIAASADVGRLVFGSLDFSLDLGLDETSEAGRSMLDGVRHQLVLHARAALMAQPLDGVYPNLDDEAGLAREAKRARDLGMGGLLCVHPVQIRTIHEAFEASPAELAWAKKVLAAAAGAPGAFRLDGSMVDEPVLRRARRILQLS